MGGEAGIAAPVPAPGGAVGRVNGAAGVVGMAGSATGGGTGIVPLAGTTGNTAGTLIGLDDSALGSGGRLGVGGVITGAAAGALVMGISGGGLPLVGSLLGPWPAIATRPPSDTPRTPAIIFQRDNSMV